jgi:hypothetical protein
MIGFSVLPQPNITTRNMSSYSGTCAITTPTSFHPTHSKASPTYTTLTQARDSSAAASFPWQTPPTSRGSGNIAAAGDSCATRHDGPLSCSPSRNKYRNVVTRARAAGLLWGNDWGTKGRTNLRPQCIRDREALNPLPIYLSIYLTRARKENLARSRHLLNWKQCCSPGISTV